MKTKQKCCKIRKYVCILLLVCRIILDFVNLVFSRFRTYFFERFCIFSCCLYIFQRLPPFVKFNVTFWSQDILFSLGKTYVFFKTYRNRVCHFPKVFRNNSHSSKSFQKFSNNCCITKLYFTTSASCFSKTFIFFKVSYIIC